MAQLYVLYFRSNMAATELRQFDDGTVVEQDSKRACPRPMADWKHEWWRYQGVRQRGSRGVDLSITRVRTPSGRCFEFQSKNRAFWWGAIWSRTGGARFVVKDGLIPCEVAVLGKPAIATYLSAVQELPLPYISNLLDVSVMTVYQYRSDFTNGRR